MASEAKREQLSNRDITKQLEVFRKAVFDELKRYTETATTSSNPIPRRKRSILTKPIMQAAMKRNPRRSMMRTVSQLGILRSYMHGIFKNYLRLTAYKNSIQTVAFSSFQAKTT